MTITTDVDMEALIDEIHFSWCLGGDNLMNPQMCIPVERVIAILGRHIPEMAEFFKTADLQTKEKSTIRSTLREGT